jgi:hypothetical protein
MNPCFQLLFFLLFKSLGLCDPKLKLRISQIETEFFFSLDGILMNLKRCRLQVDHLDKFFLKQELT